MISASIGQGQENNFRSEESNLLYPPVILDMEWWHVFWDNHDQDPWRFLSDLFQRKGGRGKLHRHAINKMNVYKHENLTML